MKTRMISAVMAAFMLATASVGGITASAAERASAEEGTAETTAVDDEDSSAETTETTASEPADESSTVTESSDDMEKFREVMSELAEAETTDVVPDYDGDPYYDIIARYTEFGNTFPHIILHDCRFLQSGIHGESIHDFIEVFIPDKMTMHNITAAVNYLYRCACRAVLKLLQSAVLVYCLLSLCGSCVCIHSEFYSLASLSLRF